MSDAERIRALFGDWGRGEFSRGLELFSADLRFRATQPEGMVEETGPEGVRRFMRRFLPEWDRYTVELEELEDFGGGRYLASVTQRGTGAGSGMEITSPVSVAITMRGGAVVQLEFHMSDREAALAALGVNGDP